jgi:hypothetical protein
VGVRNNTQIRRNVAFKKQIIPTKNYEHSTEPMDYLRKRERKNG